jgi:hypothetical protein
MTAKRLDAIVGIPNKDKSKTYWTKVGTAFESKTGNGWTLFLDFVPLHRSDDGKVMISLVEPSPKQEGGGRPQGKTQQGRARDDLDDEMPF